MTPKNEPTPERQAEHTPLLEVLRRARNVADTLGVCDPSLAQSLVDSLNQDAVTMGLTGRQATVRSTMFSWQRESFDFANARTLMADIEDMPTEGEYEMTVTGFQKITAGGRETLLYRFEATSSEPTSSYVVAFAPYKGTEIDFKPTEEERKIRSVADWEAFSELTLKRLFEIESPVLQEDLKGFLDDYDATKHMTAEALSDVGTSAMNLLAHPEIASNKDARTLIVTMLNRMMTPGRLYFFGGSFAEADEDPTKPISATFHGGRYRVTKTLLLHDYDIDPITEEITEGTAWQPAFEVAQGAGKFESRYFVPLRYLQEFKISNSCEPFNQSVMRHLKVHPPEAAI